MFAQLAAALEKYQKVLSASFNNYCDVLYNVVQDNKMN